MDFFGIFSSKSKKAQYLEQEKIEKLKAINDLKEMLELIEKKNIFNKKRIKEAHIEAKTYLEEENKHGALISLTKKKQYEAELEKNQGMQIVLESQIYSLESVTMQKAIVDALSQGNKSIKKLNTDLKPEKIEELMDEIQEEADNFKSIQDAMSQPLQQIYNDTDLLDELGQLETEVLSEELLKVPSQQKELPKVPTTDLPKVKTEDEDIEFELDQLKKSMFAMAM